VAGLPRAQAGLGNRALVAEGYATTPASGVYQLTRQARQQSPEPG
jgi:hypothetical protein